MKYEAEVKQFLKDCKKEKVKADVITLFNYLNREFANELALKQRDFELGLCDDNCKKLLLAQSYHKENKLRAYLGLDPLPEIDLSII